MFEKAVRNHTVFIHPKLCIIHLSVCRYIYIKFKGGYATWTVSVPCKKHRLCNNNSKNAKQKTPFRVVGPRGWVSRYAKAVGHSTSQRWLHPLLLKTPCTSDIGLGRFEQNLTWKPPPWALAFQVLGGTMQAIKTEEQPIVIPSCDTYEPQLSAW